MMFFFTESSPVNFSARTNNAVQQKNCIIPRCSSFVSYRTRKFRIIEAADTPATFSELIQALLNFSGEELTGTIERNVF